MRDNYFKEFDDALLKFDIKDSSLKEKYERRYDFGIEAGLNEAEVEKRLGNPIDIVREYARDREDFKECSKYMDIEISSLYDNVEIIESEDDTYKVEFDGVDMSLYKYVKNNTEIRITNTAKSYFKSKNSRGMITINIPANAKLGEVDISVAQGSLDIDNIECYNVNLSTQGGKLLFDTIIAKEASISTVSAEVSGDSLKVKRNTKLSTISGKIDINFLISDELKIESVSGDVDIHDCDANVKSTSITGDINVSGIETKRSLKQYVKDIFKK